MGDFTDDLYRLRTPRAGAPAPAPVQGSRFDTDDLYALRTPKKVEEDRRGPTDPHEYTKRAAREFSRWGGRSNPDNTLMAREALLDKYRMQEESSQGIETETNIGVDHHKRGLKFYNEKNPIASYAAGVNESLGQTGESLIGMYSPTYANKLRDAREGFMGKGEGVAGTLGRAIGTIGSTIATIGSGGAGGIMKGAGAIRNMGFLGLKPVGKAAIKARQARGLAVSTGLFGQQGAGGARQNIAEQRGQPMYDPMTGEFIGMNEISGMDEFYVSVLTGLIEGGSGAASYGLAQKFGKLFLGPELRAALAQGSRQSGVTKAILMMTNAGMEGGEEGLAQLANNWVDMIYEITPGLKLSDGVLANAGMGAAMGPIASGATRSRWSTRKAAAEAGSPTTPGTTPNADGMDSTAEQDPPKAWDPHEDRTGSKTPVRSNGKPHEMTPEMYVDQQNERGLTRADRVIGNVSNGNIAVENALYKGMNMHPPVGGESGYEGHLTRMAIMRKSKSKPKKLDSVKTEKAVALRLRQADPTLSVEDAKMKASQMVARVAKYTQSIIMEDQALAQHARLTQNALRLGKGVPAEVAKHYKPDPETYLGAASLLGLEPNEVMMVAAHQNDLRSAQKAGLKAAFVPRPDEFGPERDVDTTPDPAFDFVASSFEELATKLGV